MRARRPKGTTRELMKVRRERRLEREEHNESEIEQSLRRSKRIKDKNLAMIVIDEEIPKNVEQEKNSEEWKVWQWMKRLNA